jgi:hypothetical protein
MEGDRKIPDRRAAGLEHGIYGPVTRFGHFDLGTSGAGQYKFFSSAAASLSSCAVWARGWLFPAPPPETEFRNVVMDRCLRNSISQLDLLDLHDDFVGDPVRRL